MAQQCSNCTTLISSDEIKNSVEPPLCNNCFEDMEIDEETFEVIDESRNFLREKYDDEKKDKRFVGIVEVIVGGVFFLFGFIFLTAGLINGYFYILPFVMTIGGIGAFAHSLTSGNFSFSGDDPLDDLLIEKGVDPTSVGLGGKLNRRKMSSSEAVHDMMKDFNRRK